MNRISVAEISAGMKIAGEPAFHPPGEYLIDFAARASSRTDAGLIAIHLSVCRQCRADVANLEVIAGLLLDRLPGAPVAADLLARVLDRADRAAPRPETAPARAAPAEDYLGRLAGNLQWTQKEAGLMVSDLGGFGQAGEASMIRIEAEAVVPSHGHARPQLAIVLTGALKDERGHYQAGDVVYADETVTHATWADAGGDCLCLRVRAAR